MTAVVRRAKTTAICVSLDRASLKLLDDVARETGSRSAAVRRLLDLSRQFREGIEMEKAYREYFSQPENRRRERELTDELLPLALGARKERRRGGATRRSSR